MSTILEIWSGLNVVSMMAVVIVVVGLFVIGVVCDG